MVWLLTADPEAYVRNSKVKVAWSIFAFLLVLYPIVQFGLPKYRRSKAKRVDKSPRFDR